MSKPSRQNLTDYYASRAIRQLVQLDVHLDPARALNDQSDPHSDYLSASIDYVLQDFPGVRLSFGTGSRQETVQHALRRLYAWVDRGDLWQPRYCQMTGLELPPLVGEPDATDWHPQRPRNVPGSAATAALQDENRELRRELERTKTELAEYKQRHYN